MPGPRANAGLYITEEDLEEAMKRPYTEISLEMVTYGRGGNDPNIANLEQVNSIITEISRATSKCPKTLDRIGMEVAIAELLLLDQYSDLGYTPSERFLTVPL